MSRMICRAIGTCIESHEVDCKTRYIMNKGGERGSCLVLSGILSRLPCSTPTFKEGLAVLVHLYCSNDDVAWVDADVDSSTVDLVPRHSIDIDNPLLPANVNNLALGSLM